MSNEKDAVVIEENIELDEKLMDRLDDEFQSAIEKIMNEKEWESFGPELLTILMNMAVQVAQDMGMTEEDFVDFGVQFFEEEIPESEENKSDESIKINTFNKMKGSLN